MTREELLNRLDTLTQQELVVLTVLSRGLGTKDVAKFMRVSEPTVARHRVNVIRKLGTTIVGAVRYGTVYDAPFMRDWAECAPTRTETPPKDDDPRIDKSAPIGGAQQNCPVDLTVSDPEPDDIADVYVPTEEEIREGTAAFRETWDAREENRRFRGRKLSKLAEFGNSLRADLN